MKSGAKVALAVAAGYYLGRHRKLRLAAALAAAGAAGRLRERGGGLLHQGVRTLGSPQLEELIGGLGQELRQAGKTAAVTATGRRIDTLSDLIHDRAEKLRGEGRRESAPADDARTEDAGREPAESGAEGSGDRDE